MLVNCEKKYLLAGISLYLRHIIVKYRTGSHKFGIEKILLIYKNKFICMHVFVACYCYRYESIKLVHNTNVKILSFY